LWNACIFLFSTETILEAFVQYAPNMLERVQCALNDEETDLVFMRLAPDPWAEIEDILIDYAVMERAKNLAVIPYDRSWSDLGDWQAVWRESDANSAGVVANGPSTAIDCKNTLLHASGENLELAGIGLENQILGQRTRM
jgi:mannose-1-phosphate guanylyltransferase/mannose-6-phosphate isomerase